MKKNMKIALKVKGQISPIPTNSSIPMGHIPTKLHQFLISSFQDLMQTDTQSLPKTIPAHSMGTGTTFGVRMIAYKNSTHINAPSQHKKKI